MYCTSLLFPIEIHQTLLFLFIDFEIIIDFSLQGDWFGANRSSMDFDWAQYLLNKGNTISMEEYDGEQTSNLLMDSSKISRINYYTQVVYMFDVISSRRS